jgi:steroid 5-alpha reductase family enzyme
MNPLPLLHVLAASTVLLLAGWLVQRRLHNAGLADLLWAACIAGSALYYGVVAGGSLVSQMLVTVMGGIWGFRLIMHLLTRMLNEREDARYRHLRHRWNGNQLRFLLLFAGRALSATLFSVPLYVAAANPLAQAEPWTVLAAVVYLVGLSGEAYADMQLAEFRSKPKHLGHTCRSGLWRFSRHPNYLFGCLHWFSYVFLAIGMPWHLWALTLLGPLLTMLGWIGAIPAAEAQALRTRGDDYRAYQRSTNLLLPGLPKGWPNDRPDASNWHTPLAVARVTTPVTPRRTPAPAYRLPADMVSAPKSGEAGGSGQAGP